MKRVSKLFLSFCLVMGLGAAMAARAQIDSDVTIEANIPHAFMVKDKQLPPGSYMVKVANKSGDLNVLEIRSHDGHTAVLFETESIQVNRAPGTSELVFDKVGDKYFLSQVFLKGDENGNQLAKSKMQRELEDGGLKAERRSIAANRKQTKRSDQSAKKSS